MSRIGGAIKPAVDIYNLRVYNDVVIQHSLYTVYSDAFQGFHKSDSCR